MVNIKVFNAKQIPYKASYKVPDVPRVTSGCTEFLQQGQTSGARCF
jgi:hypothetical protein